jgi:Ni/Co efflux regulator RcnB
MNLAKLHLLAPALLGLALAGFGAPARAGDDDGAKRGWDDRYERHDRHDRYDRDDRRWDRYSDRRDWDRRDRRWDRHDDRRDWRRDRGRVVYREVYHEPVYAYGYGYGPRRGDAPPPRHSRHYGPPRWARGHRIHDYGWAPTYVIVDYGRYGLRHPPYGYHWRRDDRGDWLLVAIASGIIADVIFR